METWDIRALAIEPHQPQVLRSDAETRAIAIRLPAGEELQEHLSLCARCSGIYLGSLSALLMLGVLRRRSSRLPARQMLAIVGVFFGAMVLDGPLTG